MTKFIVQNWSVKLLCFAAASILWIYVSASQNSVGKFPSSIKIKAINTPSGLVALYDTKVVNVKVMAEPNVWRKLSPDSFSAYLDLSGLTEGTNELPVNVVSSVPGVQVVERDPAQLFVTLEPIISKTININERTEGSAAEGLVTGDVELDPNQTSVKGPRSIVNNLTEATVVLTLNGESQDFEKTLAVNIYDDQGEIITDVELSPNQVKASVPIVKASNNKTVGVKVKINGTPKLGYYISNIAVTPPVVDITGTRSVVADVNFIETYPIDVSNKSDTFETDVNLSISNGLALQTGMANKVKVKITLAPNEVSKEMIVPLTYDNLDVTQKVSAITPAEVRVICSGSAEAINSLKVADLVANLDLKSRVNGIYNFDLTTASITAPTGVSVVSVLPSAVAVTLEKK